MKEQIQTSEVEFFVLLKSNDLKPCLLT